MKTDNVFVLSMLEQMENIYIGIKTSIHAITFILQVAFPVILGTGDFTLTQKIVLSVIWLYVTSYLTLLDMRMNNKGKDGFPLPPCELTETDKEGLVSLKEGKGEVALIYLSDIEDYLKKENRHKKTVDIYRKT